MKMIVCMGFIIQLAIASSCKPDKIADPNNNEPETGVVKGKVTDASGKPIAGATIVINNTVFFNKNIVLTTNAGGEYRVKMPATDSWYVRGFVNISYNGLVYELQLHPEFAGAFTGMDGKIVNLVLKSSGQVPPDFGHSGYYGGKILAQSVLLNLNDLYGVELTLEPVGPMIDGSSGITIKQTSTKHANEFILEDVPMGRYKVSAKLNGDPLYLNPVKGDPFAQYKLSHIMDFEPSYPGATTYRIAVNLSTEP